MNPIRLRTPFARSGPLLLASALATSVGATFAQTTELKLADTMPAGHTIHKAVTDLMIREVQRLSDGKLALKHFPGGQLGKGPDALRLIQTGLQDVGMISPAHISDKLPLSSVSELPGLWTRSCEASVALWKMSRDGQILQTREFGPNGVRALAFFPLPGYQLMISSARPFQTLKDVEGLKIRSSGGALERIVRSMKAAPIRMTAPELYEAMSRGTVDGALFSFQAATSYNITKLVKASTDGQNLGTIVAGYFISDKKWQSLPESTRSVLLTAGERATREGCEGLDQAETQSKAQLLAAGVKLVTLSAQDQAALDRSTAEVQQEWAQDLDKRGAGGSAVLEAFKSALKP